MSHPSYVIRSGHEEQALPLTSYQEAALAAIHRDFGLPSPLNVLPPVKGNQDLTATASDSRGARVLMEVGPAGHVYRVAARYEFGGFYGWVNLDADTSDLALRVEDIARHARLAALPAEATAPETGSPQS